MRLIWCEFMKVLKTIIHVVEWAVCIAILLLCLLIAAPVLPSKYKIQPYVVITGSMKPMIQIGSVSLVQKVATADLKKGDIIAFDNPNNKTQVIIHRIVDIKPTIVNKRSLPFFITKGDANSSKDNWEVVPGAVKGKYIVSVPYLGYVLSEIKKPFGFLLIIGIPSLILIFVFAFQLIMAIIEEINKKNNKKKGDIKTSYKVGTALFLLLFTLVTLTFKTINASWLKDINASGISISAIDFVPPPVPTLLTPTNNSYKNTLGLEMDWSTELDYLNMHNPVYYIFQSALNSGFAPAAYTSGHLSSSQIPAPGTPNGVYWWHVKACDTLDNCSDWSPSWKVTVDSTAPAVPSNLHFKNPNLSCGGATNSPTITADWDDSSDINIDKYEVGFFVPPSSTETTGYVSPSESDAAFSAGEGVYGYRLRAIDLAGNTSGWTSTDFSSSCKVTYDVTAPPAASLSVTGSGYKAVEEKISNGDFESGSLTGWTSYGNVQAMASDTGITPSFTVTPAEGTDMARIGRINTYVWQNRLMQSFDSGAKSLSLNYNFFSRDVAPNDDPGFFIRLNGQEIFSLASNTVNPTNLNDGNARSTGWQQFYYNLSNVTDSKVNLAIYAGNTSDTTQNSWVYVDKITTYFISARGTADYKISGTDLLSGIANCHYQVDGDTDNLIASGDTFQITGAGTHTLSYYCTDNAGNISPINPVSVITDTTAPGDITDLSATATTANSITLSWTDPGNDGATGRAAEYDVRYSTTNITNDIDFDAATKVEKVPSPQNAGGTENLEVIGLNPSTTYYFAIKTLDEAPNTSGLSNILTANTAIGSTVNAGDIIINELMWMGSSVAATDKWLELRNMTDHSIDLTGMYLTRLASGIELTMPIDFTGKSILAHGYFLVAKSNDFSGSDSQLNVTPDIWDIDLGLSTTTLQIKLYDSLNNPIDIAWNGTAPTEGLYVTTVGAQKYYSMERTSIPGDGTNQLNWYSCIDAASTTDYFDGGADERGTPRAQNRSENEPYNRYYSIVIPTPTIAIVATPEASFTLADDKKTVSFSVNNITGYDKLSYELSYDAFSSVKGLVGSDIDISSQDTYEKNALDLATCSGEVCTYDQDVKNFKLTVTLKATDGTELKLEKSL